MNRSFNPILAGSLLAVAGLIPYHSTRAETPEKTTAAKTSESAADETTAAPVQKINAPANVDEARDRARLLNETIHGALQVIHRDFFDADDENIKLPSQSLKDVFKELNRSFGVDIHWLGVNATKSADHRPQDAFEREAADALMKGQKEFEAVERNVYRHVGSIRVQNECLKCHAPRRTSLEDRIAGLAISIPLKKADS